MFEQTSGTVWYCTLYRETGHCRYRLGSDFSFLKAVPTEQDHVVLRGRESRVIYRDLRVQSGPHASSQLTVGPESAACSPRGLPACTHNPSEAPKLPHPGKQRKLKETNQLHM